MDWKTIVNRPYQASVVVSVHSESRAAKACNYIPTVPSTGARPALIQTHAGIRAAWTDDDIYRFVALRNDARS